MLPVIAVVAMSVWLVMALAQLRGRRSATTPMPVWRARTGDSWTDWHVLRGSEVCDRAVAELVEYCLRATEAWPESASVAYHAVLSTALDRAQADGVQFAIVRAAERAPAFATEVLFMSPVHQYARC